MRRIIEDILLESGGVLRGLLQMSGVIEKAVKAILVAYRGKKKVVVFGNGGSAADSQHLAAELVCRFEKERRALNAIALTTNTSVLTAVANDYSYDRVFARQIEPLVERGDVVIAISTSGNSPNVLEGARQARKQGAFLIGWTGKSGGKLKKTVDLCINIPSETTARIQEGHLVVLHVICKLIEESLFRQR